MREKLNHAVSRHKLLTAMRNLSINVLSSLSQPGANMLLRGSCSVARSVGMSRELKSLRSYLRGAIVIGMPTISCGAVILTSSLTCFAENQITNWSDGADPDPSFAIELDSSGKTKALGIYQQMIDDPLRERALGRKLAARAYNNRGWLLIGTDRTRALANLNRAIKLDPTLDRAYYNRLHIYNDLGRWKEAIADCNEVIELNPSCVVIYYHRAVAHGGLKDWKKAVDDCSIAIERNRKFANAYKYRAYALEKLGNLDLAKADKEKGHLIGRAED